MPIGRIEMTSKQYLYIFIGIKRFVIGSRQLQLFLRIESKRYVEMRKKCIDEKDWDGQFLGVLDAYIVMWLASSLNIPWPIILGDCGPIIRDFETLGV